MWAAGWYLRVCRSVVRRSKMFLVELALIFVVAQALGLTVLYWASRRASRARAALAPFTAAAAYLTASWVFCSDEADWSFPGKWRPREEPCEGGKWCEFGRYTIRHR